MDFAVISMPKSRQTTRIFFDGATDSLQDSTIQSTLAKNETRAIENTSTFNDQELITTSTPYPIFENPIRHRSSTLRHLKVLKNPMEQSILKNSQKRKSSNKKKVFFMSPEIVEISSIDEKMRKSFMVEQKKVKATPGLCSLPKGTPIRQQPKIRPRLLNFTESASKLDTKKTQNKKVESKVKRLTGGKKTSPIQQQQEKVKVAESFLKGVKLNRRFELLMKHLANTKSSGN